MGVVEAVSDDAVIGDHRVTVVVTDPDWVNVRFIWRGGSYIEEELYLGGRWKVVEALHFAEEKRAYTSALESRCRGWYEDVTSRRTVDQLVDLTRSSGDSAVII